MKYSLMCLFEQISKLRKWLFYTILVSMISISCNNSLNEAIEGQWVLEIFDYENQNVLPCLNINSILFKSQTVQLFSFNCTELVGEFLKKDTWNIFSLNGEVFIKIEHRILPFNDTFRLKFFIDEKLKLLKIELKSKKGLIIATKMLLDFEYNKKLINDVIEKTAYQPSSSQYAK